MRLAGAVVCVLAAAAVVSAAAPVTPADAIAAAVQARFGRLATIVVSDVITSVADEPALVAQPDVTARVGKRSRFLLTASGVRRGFAVATIAVRMAYPRAARSIARNEAIDRSAIDLSEADVPSLLIAPPLDIEAITGRLARRNIIAGEALTATILRIPPVVKSGDAVEATVRFGPVSATGTGIASGSGGVGDIIRIMQPHSSRLLNARITGPGAVEIVE